MYGEHFLFYFNFSPHSTLKQVATCHIVIMVAQLISKKILYRINAQIQPRAELKELLLEICLQHHGQHHGFIDIQHSSATDGSETWLRSEILTCTNLGRSAVHGILI